MAMAGLTEYRSLDDKERTVKPLPPELLIDDQTFAEVLRLLHTQKFTGSFLVHSAEGCAIKVEFPGEPTIIRLDRRQQKRVKLTR